MTVIAFDGKTLAADRLSSNHGHRQTVRKIMKLGDGSLVAACGDGAHAMQLLRWASATFSLGLTPEFPVCPDRENYADLWRVTPDGRILLYKNGPEPLRYLDKTFVAGAGRDYAAGAMSMGADARRAVEIAIEHHIYCGGGIDVLDLEPEAVS